jgi:hypothetical protein
MIFKQKVIYSWLISSGALLASILFPIIPCQIGPNVPNPSYAWSMCRLSPDLMRDLTEIKTFFFGYTTSMTESYFILLILVFAIAFGVMHLLTKRKKE